MVRHSVGNSRADSGIVHAALVAAFPIHPQAQDYVMDSDRLAWLVAPRRSFPFATFLSPGSYCCSGSILTKLYFALN
jgi:hypothetical protein